MKIKPLKLIDKVVPLILERRNLYTFDINEIFLFELDHRSIGQEYKITIFEKRQTTPVTNRPLHI